MVYTMIATTALTHRGKPVKPGARIEATKVEAAVYAYRRQAKFAPKTTQAKSAPAPSPHVQPRDITPDVPSPPADVPETAEPDAPARRHSKRRDITPEDE